MKRAIIVSLKVAVISKQREITVSFTKKTAHIARKRGIYHGRTVYHDQAGIRGRKEASRLSHQRQTCRDHRAHSGGPQAANEGEIAELDHRIKNAVIAEENDDNSVVHIGTVVTVFDMEFQEEVAYTIKGSTEADAMNNIISNESPVGAALLGHKKGDTVTVKAPNGEYGLKILKIELNAE